VGQILEPIASGLTLEFLGLILVGIFIGVIVGALPGISTSAMAALLAIFAYTMTPLHALIFIASAHVASTYGGSITAVVLNIPGTPASAATCLEGYPLARRGEGELALSVSVMSSFWANAFAAILLILSMPLIARVAVFFDYWEMFWFSIFGVKICAQLSRGDVLKGLIAACFGMIISFVGPDPILGTEALRFTYGISYLQNGVRLIPAMVGLYGIAIVFRQLTDVKTEAMALERKKLFAWGEIWRHKWLVIRTSFLGFLVGVIPGVGSDVASWVGYNHAYTSSKHKERFGTDETLEGVIGTETSNNACAVGSYAPMLALGIPGDGVTAVVLIVLAAQGVLIGPAFLGDNPEFLPLLFLSFMIAGIGFLLMGTFFSRAVIRLLNAPMPIVMACVASLCVIGAFSASRRYEDIALMFALGLVGLAMNKTQFPVAPMLLGIVVGGSLVDANFRWAILAGDGSLVPFFTRPLSLGLVLILALMLFVEFVLPLFRRPRRKEKEK